MKRAFLTVAIVSLLFLPQKGIGEESFPFLLKAVISSEGRILFQVPVQPQDSICLRTIHSLALTPYAHFYRMDEDGNLILSSAEYVSGGGGYPESGDGVFSVVNGKFRMDRIDRFIGLLRFRVSPISRETLILAERGGDRRAFFGLGGHDARQDRICKVCAAITAQDFGF